MSAVDPTRDRTGAARPVTRISRRAESWSSDREWMAAVRASDARRAAETVDVVNGMDDAEVIKDVLRSIARHDSDVVRQALEENGVTL